jgi:hypothetical protein
LLNVPTDRRLQPAEAEVEIPFQRGRVPVGVRQPRRRQRDRTIVPPAGQPVNDRPTRISESQQLGDLVVRFSRGIVACPAQKLVIAGTLDEIQARVPARHDEHDGGKRKLAVLQHQRLDVTRRVMHGDQRQAGCRGAGFRERNADQQGSHKPGL